MAMKLINLTLVFVLTLFSVSTGQKENSQCEEENGICVGTHEAQSVCSGTLLFDCGSNAVCCRKENMTRTIRSSEVELIQERTKRQVPCAKTRKRCSREGGICIPTGGLCGTVTIKKLCRRSSCTCCLGDNLKCGASAACTISGGICINRKKKRFCASGIIDETLCGLSSKCSCCLLGPVIVPVRSSRCTCGQLNGKEFDSEGKISSSNNYPWNVDIKNIASSTSCNATIISDRYIITAAHCLIHPETEESVTSNDIVLSVTHPEEQAENGAQTTKVLEAEELIIHDDFEYEDLEADIALIKLTEPLDFDSTKGIGPVCLPKDTITSYEGYDGVVTDLDDSTTGLQEVSVSILNCEDNMSEDVENLDEFICVEGKENNNVCNSQSARPLFVKEDGSYTLVGISSNGMGCSEEDSPVIYTKLTSYLDWIKENTNGSKHCSK